ncbi:hypothetical protein F5B17DRAFT_444991 [Nemania serpens]|nr:hypothetical protein F5B17DRAFT_444991 [Nemania serpens]
MVWSDLVLVWSGPPRFGLVWRSSLDHESPPYTSSPTPTSSSAPTPSPTPPSPYEEPPDELIQDRITYVKRASVAKKGSQKGLSHIWKYGIAYIRQSDKKEVYFCHECAVEKSRQELFVINSTSRIRSYLEQKHRINLQSGFRKQNAAASTSFF